MSILLLVRTLLLYSVSVVLCSAFASRTINKIEMFSALSMTNPRIALTREKGANDKLLSCLTKFDCIEMPCLSFTDLPVTTEKFRLKLSSANIVAITSPQSASVFLRIMQEIGKASLCIASIGAGTTEVLENAKVTPMFEPSRATAECMAAELPLEMGKNVFYPASELADATLQQRLERRGFKVTRLNTYTTVPAKWTAENKEAAFGVNIVTFASPSAAKIWSAYAGTEAVAVAIGPTTAEAATKAGFKKVFYPTNGDKLGIQAWADKVGEAAASLQQ